MWVVMRAFWFKNIGLDQSGYRLPLDIQMADPIEEPYRFLPVFESYEAALAWEDGDPTHIVEVREAISGGQP